MTAPVLDASALLAMLLDEPGSAKVRALLVDAAMTVVNLGEVVGHYARGGMPRSAIHLMLDPLPIERVPFDEDLAYRTGLLLPATKSAGLSFGDRACLALAQRRGTRAVTADRNWQRIAEAVSVDVAVLR